MKGKISNGVWILRLDVGDKLPESITKFCEHNKIQSGQLSGIGAVSNTTLGFYSLENKKYIETKYPKHHELISLKGNITQKEGKTFAHLHMIIGDSSNKCYGGHLVTAKISATAEIFITPLERVERTKEKNTGLHTWNI